MERSLRSRKTICLAKNNKTAEDYSTNSNTSEVLNDDCLLYIFEYLPISDRIRLERVNKRWCAVSKKSWPRCKKLTFTNYLWGCQNDAKVTKKALEKVLSYCGKYLKVLDMSTTPVLAEKVNISSLLKLCPNLTSADFGSIIVGVPLIESLIKYCKSIVVFNISRRTPYVTIQLINNTLLSTYKNLRILKIEGLCSRDCLEFKNNDSIQEVYLQYCMEINMHNLIAVSQLKNLHTLSLKGSVFIPDLVYIKLPNIVKLDISHNYLNVDDNALIKITSSCTRLTNLNISDNHNITDRGLRAAISSSNLEVLEINHLHRVTGSSLSNLPYLKKLSCQYCRSIEDVHFQTLFTTSKKLEHIDLRGIRNVGNIIKTAIQNIEFRTSDVPLVMLIDKVDVDSTGMPDTLKLILVEDE